MKVKRVVPEYRHAPYAAGQASTKNNAMSLIIGYCSFVKPVKAGAPFQAKSFQVSPLAIRASARSSTVASAL